MAAWDPSYPRASARPATTLPPFQQPPARPGPGLLLNGRASSLGSTGSGLLPTFSMGTDRSSLAGDEATEEEEELTRELTIELAQDFHLGGGSVDGRHSSLHSSCRASQTLAEESSEAGVAELEGGSRQGSPEDLQPSLYEQLGGGVAVKLLVDAFYSAVLTDPELETFFEGVDMHKHTRKFLMFATYVLGGPDEYLRRNPEPWPALYSVHARLIEGSGLTERHFDLVKDHFADALQHVGASTLQSQQALAIVEATRRIIFPASAPAEQQQQPPQRGQDQQGEQQQGQQPQRDQGQQPQRGQGQEAQRQPVQQPTANAATAAAPPAS